MNLGQCEYILKNEYNISQNDPLYILQIIYEEQGMKIPKLEYEVYYPLHNNPSLTKLNLTHCQNTKIEVLIAARINETLDKHNPDSNYYNNICSKSASKSGTDIPIKVRRNDFIENNMSLCEENCELIEYNYTIEKVKCSCDIKTSIPSNYDIKFNKKDFLKHFIDIKNIANLNIMKCYITVFKIKDIKNNKGFYIQTFIIVLFFITLLIFLKISYIKLIKQINNIYSSLKNKDMSFKTEKLSYNVIKIKIEKKLKKKNKNKNIIIENVNKNDNIIEDSNSANNDDSNSNKEINMQNNKLNKKKIFFGLITQNKEDNSLNKKNMIPFENVAESNNNNVTNKYLDIKAFEMNSLDYEEAIKLDNRNYFEYYISLIKYNHPIMFSFSHYNDYNSRIIKMFLFFFSFSLDFTVNALFFSDDTRVKIYEDKGKFNFLYHIPQILYSTIIVKFIDALIRNFALSQDNIIELKKEKEKERMEQKYKKIKLTLKIKFISFFISSFIVEIFFWYYITCFCGIYINTQDHLIKDSTFSLATSLLIPFGLYLIPGIFRITALRAEKHNRRLMYKFSCLLENYLS